MYACALVTFGRTSGVEVLERVLRIQEALHTIQERSDRHKAHPEPEQQQHPSAGTAAPERSSRGKIIKFIDFDTLINFCGDACVCV